MHMAQLIPLPLTVSCFSKIQIGFTFLVPAHLGSPGQRAVKRVCLCVCLCSACFLRQLTTWHCPHLLLRAAAAAERRLCMQQSIGISCSSGPQQQSRSSDVRWGNGTDRRTDRQTGGERDGRTPYLYTDPAPYAVSADEKYPINN